MVDGQQLHHRRQVDPVADDDAALPAQHAELADQAVGADMDAGPRQVPEVVDMQDGMVHDIAAGADADAPRGAGMQVDALVQVCASPQADAVGEAQPHPALDGRRPVHGQDQAVGQGAQADAPKRGHAAAEGGDQGLPQVAGGAGGLTLHVGAAEIQHGVGSGPQGAARPAVPGTAPGRISGKAPPLDRRGGGS